MHAFIQTSPLLHAFIRPSLAHVLQSDMHPCIHCWACIHSNIPFVYFLLGMHASIRPSLAHFLQASTYAFIAMCSFNPHLCTLLSSRHAPIIHCQACMHLFRQTTAHFLQASRHLCIIGSHAPLHPLSCMYAFNPCPLHTSCKQTCTHECIVRQSGIDSNPPSLCTLLASFRSKILNEVTKFVQTLLGTLLACRHDPCIHCQACLHSFNHPPLHTSGMASIQTLLGTLLAGRQSGTHAL